MNKREAVEFLKRSLNEINTLLTLPHDNNEYPLWEKTIEGILGYVFGRDSFEYKSFVDATMPFGVENNREYREELQMRETAILAILNKNEILGIEEKPETTGALTGPPKAFIAKANWGTIENEFGITKRAFGRAINFVSDNFVRNIIFRDVEHAFLLASSGFSKPAVILAGGVIEELLRLYLEYKNISPLSDNFDGYITTCKQEGLLKDSVSRLSHAVRQFRNLVHLSAEETKKHTISKATAKGAVSSIFTIANDF